MQSENAKKCRTKIQKLQKLEENAKTCENNAKKKKQNKCEKKCEKNAKKNANSRTAHFLHFCLHWIAFSWAKVFGDAFSG